MYRLGQARYGSFERGGHDLDHLGRKCRVRKILHGLRRPQQSPALNGNCEEKREFLLQGQPTERKTGVALGSAGDDRSQQRAGELLLMTPAIRGISHPSKSWNAAPSNAFPIGTRQRAVFLVKTDRVIFAGPLKIAMTSFLDDALTLMTLASLFIIGPALGHAIVSCFNWQNWSVPIQHLVIGLCTMFAVSGMILVYGVLWERSPNAVAWYSWIQQAATVSRVPTEPVEVRQKAKPH